MEQDPSIFTLSILPVRRLPTIAAACTMLIGGVKHLMVQKFFRGRVFTRELLAAPELWALTSAGPSGTLYG